MDSSCQSADLSVRQHPRAVRVHLVEDLRHVELLQSAHYEVEIREGKLHVLGVAHAMAGGLIKLFWEANRRDRESGGKKNKQLVSPGTPLGYGSHADPSLP